MEPSRQLAQALGAVTVPARELAAGLDAGPDAQLVARQAMEIVFPERLGDASFQASILRSSLDNIDAMWRIIAGRDPLETTTPLGAFAFAETAAQVGVPVSQFERVYRVGAGLVWRCWYDHALAHATDSEVELSELIAAPSMIIHAYIDGVLSPVLERYDATCLAHHGTREHLRRSILRQALDGGAALDEREIEEALGIELDGEHIAFVVRGERPPDRTDLLAYVESACGAQTALVYRNGVQAWVVWLSRPGGFGEQRLLALRDALERSGALVALGEPGTGLGGLGASGRDALETARLQDMIGSEVAPVLSFADVRLEALFLTDPERARRFVHDELKSLDSSHERIRRLRDTALTWLTTGSHVGTASRLGVHEHTVRNRVAQIEVLLGRPLASRRTELLVALRLKRILDDAGEQSPGAGPFAAERATANVNRIARL
jgi:PucR C-terminal helix-turn-helix domain/GGDEF-like domain